MMCLARYWKDPNKFMPERFLGDWPKDAFLPFSQGMSCPSKHCDHNSRSDTNTLQVPGLVWGDGASCCGIIERETLTCLFQVLRNGGHSHHDYARVKIQD